MPYHSRADDLLACDVAVSSEHCVIDAIWRATGRATQVSCRCSLELTSLRTNDYEAGSTQLIRQRCDFASKSSSQSRIDLIAADKLRRRATYSVFDVKVCIEWLYVLTKFGESNATFSIRWS